MSRLYTDISSWLRDRAIWEGQTIGFVPTMGALHSGHLSLLRRARDESDRVILSIFVNPTQFDDPADLNRYPRALEADRALAGDLADAVLAPAATDLYADRYRYRVTESELSRKFEGAHRPGHFDGVLTVVLKLLNLVRADRAYFGEKDWQQLELVRGMAAALFLPVEIVACPTVRDPDGLALSSRNSRLTPADRTRAARFPAILRSAKSPQAAEKQLSEEGFIVDYVAEHEGVRLGAVRLDGVRLIDNVRR